MMLPPTPAKQSINIAFSVGAASETCCAIVLKYCQLGRDLYLASDTHVATGSGVTPNQASSVIHIPSSYFEKILCL